MGNLKTQRFMADFEIAMLKNGNQIKHLSTPSPFFLRFSLFRKSVHAGTYAAS
jgi:hypothetical protein